MTVPLFALTSASNKKTLLIPYEQIIDCIDGLLDEPRSAHPESTLIALVTVKVIGEVSFKPVSVAPLFSKKWQAPILRPIFIGEDVLVISR